jgi:alginate O-acetyltransferase complex protein AlgJ
MVAGKKVVIWQFAARDLSHGDWSVLKLPAPGTVVPGEVRKPEAVGNELDIRWISGRVRTVTAVPKAAGLPYPDAVICIHLDSVTAEGVAAEGQRLPDSAEPDSAKPDSEVIVYTWGLKNRRLVADHRFVAGARVKLRVRPWEQVRSQYERYYRVELEDPDFQLAELPIFWVE